MTDKEYVPKSSDIYNITDKEYTGYRSIDCQNIFSISSCMALLKIPIESEVISNRNGDCPDIIINKQRNEIRRQKYIKKNGNVLFPEGINTTAGCNHCQQSGKFSGSSVSNIVKIDKIICNDPGISRMLNMQKCYFNHNKDNEILIKKGDIVNNDNGILFDHKMSSAWGESSLRFGHNKYSGHNTI